MRFARSALIAAFGGGLSISPAACVHALYPTAFAAVATAAVTARQQRPSCASTAFGVVRGGASASASASASFSASCSSSSTCITATATTSTADASSSADDTSFADAKEEGTRSDFNKDGTKQRTFKLYSEAYAELTCKLRTVTHLRRASAVLQYDQMVFMPNDSAASAAAAEARGAQMAALASVVHEKATDASVLGLIEQSEFDLESYVSSSSSADANANADVKDVSRILELERRSYERNARIPPELESKRASLSSSAYAAWVDARSRNDFASFEPALSECFETAMEVARVQGLDKDGNGGKLGEPISLYSQMIDEYEMGMEADRIDEIFNEIQAALVPLIGRVLTSETKPKTDVLKGRFPVPVQEKLCRDVVTTLGYDPSRGRIDTSVHPFSMSLGRADVRITSRFSEDEWYQGLAATIHEGGHAMYEQNVGGGANGGIGGVDSGLDIDSYLSMGTHESQSLFWERHIGMSKAFWRWATPKLLEAFAGSNDVKGNDGTTFDCTPEELYRAVNAVSPGLIRVEADELTYPLHVILRYQIERDVVEGRLLVKDIPRRWNEAMKESLNVDVPDDARGCLQDIHWSALAIGYFPTYLIGSATAAQLAHYCHRDIPDMYKQVERGEFGSIKAWLTDKVHRHGRRYKSLDDMLEDQLGEKLNPKYFIEYLTSKYTELYNC